MEENVNKDVKFAKFLSLFEGICFFVAGICALMAGSLLGYISGGWMIIFGCANIVPVFVWGDEYFANFGMSLAEDETADECFDRIDRDKEENRK